MTLFARALAFATLAHLGQLRKNNATAYILHPIRVSQDVKTEHDKAVALLHDVLEDTKATEFELRTQFGDEIADDVIALTHRKGQEEYMDYIKRCAKRDVARRIKIIDIADNLRDAPTQKMMEKAGTALEYLLTYQP